VGGSLLLYLVQHGKAKSKDEDPKRPITDKGESEIRKVATFIDENTHTNIKTIFHSGKLRAKQTAEILAERLKPSNGLEEATGLEPNAETSIWVKRLDEITDDILIVGHLPHLNKLTSRILGQVEDKKMVDFKNSGIVCLVRDELGLWSVLWVVIPELLT